MAATQANIPSLRSIKSARSMKSEKSTKSGGVEIPGDFTDFAECLKKLSKIYQCPVPVDVKKENCRKQGILPANTKRKSRVMRRATILSPQLTKFPSDELIVLYQKPVVDDTLTLTARYDPYNHLTELLINKYRYTSIPRILMQVLCLIVSSYSQLTRFSITNCRINVYTIYELSKILPVSTIVDVCLDGCPLPEANYDIILQSASWLKYLSLCRCNINDEACTQIASTLHYLKPAEKHLVTLNLASNQITDVGAKDLADALRCNRHLRYLNLSDNRLGDDGAINIFNILMEFPMTYDEILSMRQRHIKYLKQKRTVYLECLQKLGLKTTSLQSTFFEKKRSPIASKKGLPTIIKSKTIKKIKKNTTPDDKELKASLMADEIMGPFKDPYSPASVRIKNGYTYSVGNLTLSCLNLAYNNLSFMSVKKLLTVLEYQELERKVNILGLIKVTLDGNYLPTNCPDLNAINQIIAKKIQLCGTSKLSDRVSAARKSRSRSIYIPSGRIL